MIREGTRRRFLKLSIPFTETSPNIRLLLIGDEPGPKLLQQIDALEWNEHVKGIDYVDNEELPAYYRGADVFSIPSQHEGLAIVGLEVMACGKPIVSTRCGGPEEYVIDKERGISFQPTTSTLSPIK